MSSLSNKQVKAIDLMLSGLDSEQVALEVGITTRTLRRWQSEDTEFVSILTRYRSAARLEIANGLVQDAQSARRVLTEIMLNTGIHASIRVKAASHVLNSAMEQASIDDLVLRLSEMEEMINEYRQYQGSK